MSLLAFLITSSISFAQASIEPTPLLGSFSYQGELRPIIKVEVEAVHTISNEGKARLVDLKAKSFSCRHVMRGTYRCSRPTDLSRVEDWARLRIDKQMMVKNVRFEKALGVENLVDNEDYKAWRVHGSVETPLGSYSEYLWSWTPNLSKITVTDEDREDLPKIYFNFESEQRVYQQTVVHKTIDKNRFESHVIQMVFVKEE